jgi:low temperature requirement protein LtrA
MARDVFSVLHFPMLFGVVLLAVATELALAHPGAAFAADARAALGTGALLFVGGTAVAVWRATGHVQTWRVVIAPATAIAVVLADGPPWMALATLLAGLALLAAVEHRQAA